MIAAAPANRTPPEAELQFDVGSTDDSLERMIELFARHGDTYRVYVPARRSYTYVVHHPDDVKRVLVSNHRNYTKGVGLDRVKILLGKGIMTSPVKAQRRTVPGTEGLILDLLDCDRLIASGAGVSRSGAYGNGLGEIQRQPAIIEFSANENQQCSIV